MGLTDPPASAADDASPRRAAPPSRRLLTRRLRVGLAVAVLALLTVEVVLITPQLPDMGTALRHADLRFVGLAVLAEALSLVAFAAVYQRMLRGGGALVPLRSLTSMALAANALSATLPAGSALATGYSFTRLRRLGASTALAGWTVVACGLISSAAFAVLGLAGAIVVGARAAGAVAAVLAVLAVVVAGVGLHLATRHPPQTLALAQRVLRAGNRLLRRPDDAGASWLHDTVDNLLAIRPGIVNWLVALAWAALNWAADIGCLVLACHAVGISDLSARTVLVAFAADAVAGTLQVLPGGLGTVDGALVLALVNGGVPSAAAAAAVLVYRLISFVLAAVVGWIVWLVIRRQQAHFSS